MARSLTTLASGAVVAELSAVSDLEDRLEELVRAGRLEHPSIPVDDDAWARHLARHLVEGRAVATLGQLRAGDVHLVLGCAAEHPEAVRCLDARLRAVAPLALQRIRLGATSVDDVLQDVRVHLLVGAPGAKKVETYSGRGALDAWLRVTLARAALGRLRLRSELPAAPSNDDELLDDLAGSDDPRITLLRARSMPALKGAIEQAMAALPDGTRALLRMHVVDGLTIDDLACVYGVHRATVARRVARARHELFEAARARAIAALGIGEEDFASLVGVLMSQIDLTLRTAREDVAVG